MKHFFLLLGAGWLSGCVYTLAPHTPYLPVLRNRGEAEARVGTGIGGSEVQFGYQATDRLVLHTGLLSHGRLAAGYRFRSAEVGAGYYYPSPNGRWRLGMHAGLAYGGGTSGGNGCFECGNSPFSKFDVRYAYAYVQPTVLLLENDRYTWGLALMLGHTRYPQLDELRTNPIAGQTVYADHNGHASTFVQPMLQVGYRARRWLTASIKVGSQGFVGAPERLNAANQLVTQASLHLVVGPRAAPRP